MSLEFLNSTMETLRPILPELYEAETKNTAYGLITKGAEKHKITKTTNGTDFRIPLKVSAPGVYGALNLAGGSFLTGTSASIKQMYQSYFPTQLAFKLDLQNIYTTEDNKLAIVNAFKDTMKDAPKRLAWNNDASLHNIGSGYQGLIALGTAVTSAGTGTETMTFDTEFAANMLYPGQRVEIFANDLGTHRTSAVPNALPYISSVDKSAGTAVIAGLGSITPSATDYLAFPGVGTTPAWMNGLYYFHNTATTGNLLGLARGTYQELIANMVNAAGALVPAHGLQLYQKIRQRTGVAPSKLKGLIHPAQVAQLYSLGLSISEWQRGKSDEMIDVVPKIGDYITYCGVSHLVDIHQSKKRIDWMNVENWGRVYLKEADFYKTPGDGKMIFESRDSDGRVAAAVEFWMMTSENFYNSLPAADGFIYDLSIPSGF